MNEILPPSDKCVCVSVSRVDVVRRDDLRGRCREGGVLFLGNCYYHFERIPFVREKCNAKCLSAVVVVADVAFYFDSNLRRHPL